MVSVVIPVYNEVNFLQECVRSVQKQTYSDIEIILVDDGSTNEAAQDCDRFSKMDSRIKVIHQENLGLSCARMCGYENAKGEWIMFVDDDDKISEDTIRTYLTFAEEGIDIITGWKNTNESDIKTRFDDEKIKCMLLSGKECCDRMPDDDIKWTPLWGKLYRKAFLDKIDLYYFKKECPTIYFEDVIINPILVFYARKICIVQEYFYFYRVLENSLSHMHLLGGFYYEQIRGGDEVCSFLKTRGMNHHLSIKVSSYMKSILRIYCLIDYDEELEMRQKKKYISDIIEMYKKWIYIYIKKGKDNVVMKIIIRCFPISKVGWKRLANNVFFIKNNRNIIKGIR